MRAAPTSLPSRGAHASPRGRAVQPPPWTRLRPEPPPECPWDVRMGFQRSSVRAASTSPQAAKGTCALSRVAPCSMLGAALSGNLRPSHAERDGHISGSSERCCAALPSCFGSRGITRPPVRAQGKEREKGCLVQFAHPGSHFCASVERSPAASPTCRPYHHRPAMKMRGGPGALWWRHTASPRLCWWTSCMAVLGCAQAARLACL